MHQTNMFHDEELEKTLIGYLIVKPEFACQVTEKIFHKSFNKQIFHELTKQFDKHGSVSLVVIKKSLPEVSYVYLSTLMDGVPDVNQKNVKHVVDRLTELRRKRDLWYLSMNIAHSLEKGDKDAVERFVEEIGKEEEGSDVDSSLTAMDLLNSFRKYQEMGGGVKFGIPSIDNLTNGIAEGEVAYLLARAKVGKSIFLQNCLRYFTTHYPADGAIMFSLEMPAPQLAERLLMIEGNADKEEVKSMPDEEREKIIERHKNIFYITKSTMTLKDIRNTIIQLKFKSNVRLVLIDFLTRIKTNIAGEYDALRASTKFIKDIAKELGVAILVVAQTGRADGRGGYGPLKLESGRGSGTIEEDADFIFGAYRPELNPYLNPGERMKVAGLYVLQMLGSRRTEIIPRINLYFNKKSLRLIEER